MVVELQLQYDHPHDGEGLLQYLVKVLDCLPVELLHVHRLQYDRPLHHPSTAALTQEFPLFTYHASHEITSQAVYRVQNISL